MTTPTTFSSVHELVRSVEQVFSDVPCEAGRHGGCGGDNPARWYGVRSCGCPVDTWCDRDRMALLNHVALHGALECVPCDVEITVRWAPIR